MTSPLSQAELAELEQPYLDMLGFVPPRVRNRLRDMAVANPDLLRAQEQLRLRLLTTPHLDPQTVQLVLVAVLAVQLRDAAPIHIAAALRAGASEESVRAAIDLAYLFGGQSVANHAPGWLAAARDLLAAADTHQGEV